MSEPVPLGDLTPTQLRRVRCLEVATLLMAECSYDVRVKVARWLYAGIWPDD